MLGFARLAATWGESPCLLTQHDTGSWAVDSVPPASRFWWPGCQALGDVLRERESPTLAVQPPSRTCCAMVTKVGVGGAPSAVTTLC